MVIHACVTMAETQLLAALKTFDFFSYIGQNLLCDTVIGYKSVDQAKETLAIKYLVSGL